jgi:hypothetical protein
MIIGNDNNFKKTTFDQKLNQVKENNDLYTNSNVNPFVEDVNSMTYNNASDTENMNNKRLAMLHERLEQGLITVEQFSKECKKINNSNE